MKRQFILLAALSLSFNLFSQVSKPGKPAFQVTYKENGKNVNQSWQYNATVKFSLSNWSSQHDYGAYDLKKTKKQIDFDPQLSSNLNPNKK